MATLQQIYYKVYSYNGTSWQYIYSNNSWQSHPEEFFDTNLISGQSTSKISIQAPPGTTIELNGKLILIGRSGLYDFDNEDIKINSIKFPRPTVTIRENPDEDKKAALEEILDKIKEDLDDAMAENYEDFCTSGQEIYKTNLYTGSSNEVSITVTGFQEAAPMYLNVLKGESYEEYGDLENVIVNYLQD